MGSDLDIEHAMEVKDPNIQYLQDGPLQQDLVTKAMFLGTC